MAGKELKNHVIICGYGLVGEKVAEIISERNIPFVVIENNPDKVEALREKGIDVIYGDATSSKVLKDAGILEAKAIAIVMDSDAKNLFASITARSLNNKVLIATRANSNVIKEKLSEIGTNFIATPNISAGEEIFNEIRKIVK
ncbi:MAG: potassium channel family protein [Candidatus Micrarchaeia archaeon]